MDFLDLNTDTSEWVPWGPNGRSVYERTYQRVKPDGTREQWNDTVQRVIAGNLSLVYGDPETWTEEVISESEELHRMMFGLKILPAGRHLWASGVPGRQYLFNCHTAGWGQKFSDHFEFMFMRLMEGGGVGSNYSSKYLAQYGPVKRALNVHIICDPEHPDYQKMKDAGVLSETYGYGWPGAFPIEDSREGWAGGLVDLLDTFFKDEVKHDNRVYDVSRVRKEGAPLRTFGGSASGPLPFARMMVNVAGIMNRRVQRQATPLDGMEIDHEIGQCVVAGGNRRSARMSILPWSDPWIQEFIECKADPSKHWTTNISVEVDEEFFRCLTQEWSPPFEDDRGVEWPQFGPREAADDILHRVAQGMLANGEPGIWNSALSAEGELGEVFCTNPCGEIILQQWENCNLGHVNLDAFIKVSDGTVSVDLAEVQAAHRLMTRFLMRATYGDVNDSKQAAVLARNRRIGVGHFGVQGMLAKLGIPFSEAPQNEFVKDFLDRMYRTVRQEARDYAFALRIPEPVKVTTVAPTGTIAKLAGRTEGIHPVYAKHYIQRIRFSTVDPTQRAQLEEYAAQGYEIEVDQWAANTKIVLIPTEELLVSELVEMGYSRDEALVLVESVDEIDFYDLLAFQAMYQEHYADNAVSFTANVIPGSIDAEEITVNLTRWLPKLKGTTVFPDLSRPQAPYTRLTAEEFDAIEGPKMAADGTDESCSTGACPIK